MAIGRKIYETSKIEIYIDNGSDDVWVVDRRTGKEFKLSLEEFETFIGY